MYTYNGTISSQRTLPGGSPQGAFLGGLIFMVKFNGAFMRPPIPRPIQTKSQSVNVKFVDDGSVAVSIDLKASLSIDPVTRPRPLTFYERTEHILPIEKNTLQDKIKEAEEFVNSNNMMINKEKTNIMMFNKSRNWSFPPELAFHDGTELSCISETKLVGVIVTDDLHWEKNTQYICKKARKKVWLLRRMKQLNLTSFQMFDVYCKEIRSILEMAVPVWHSSLTKKQSALIERIQKVSFRIILDSKYKTYTNALKLLKTETLETRRTILCQRFAIKNVDSEHSFFEKKDTGVKTRSKLKVKEFSCNTQRFAKSSLPYLAKLINSC